MTLLALAQGLSLTACPELQGFLFCLGLSISLLAAVQLFTYLKGGEAAGKRLGLVGQGLRVALIQ